MFGARLFSRRRSSKSKSPIQYRDSRLARRMFFESLEGRSLLAAFVWTGAGVAGDWNDPANWDLNASFPQNTDDTAEFADAGIETVNLTSAVSIGQLSFTNTSGSWTISNSDLISIDDGAGGGGVVEQANAVSNTLADGLTLTGDTTIDVTAGTLNINASASGVISGTGPLNKLGAGTLVLGGTVAHTYTGPTNINVGVLVAATDGALGAAADGTVIAAGATLDVRANLGTEAISAAGAGVGGNGALVTTSGTGTIGGTVTMTANTTVGGAGNLLLNGLVSGNFDLTKVGTGTTTLAAANSYGGQTNVNAGTLLATNAASLGTDANGTNVAAGATLDLRANIGNEALSIAGDGVGGLGALVAGAGTVTVGGPVTLTANSTVGGAGDLLLNGVVSGNFDLTKAGAGTLTLAGANTYGGQTNVNAGTLLATNAASLGTDANGTNVAAGATLDLRANIGNEALSIAGDGVGGIGALIAGAGPVTVGGPVTLTANSTVGGAGDLVLNGVVSGNFDLTKVGAGTLTLAGANTYGGQTNVNAGTLLATNAASLGTDANGTNVAAGATLDLRANIGNEALSIAGNGVGGIGALVAGAGTVTVGGPVTLTANSTVGGAGDLVLNGVVSGNFDLTKAGAGTLTLAGANTYGGQTNINTGTVVATNAASLGSAANGTTIASGATLDVRANIETESILVAGAGVGNNGALVTTTGAGTVGGAVTITADTTVGGAGNLTLNGVVSGNFALTKVGAGVLTLAGTNTYGGQTNINAGTVVATNVNALGSAAAGTTIASGATLDVRANIGTEAISVAGAGVGGNGALVTTVGNGAVGGAVTLTANTTIGGAGNLTLNGAVGGNFDLTKSRTGTTTLAGANTYGGQTNINAGTVVATNSSALGNAATGTTIASGATLDVQANLGTEAISVAGTGVAANGALVTTSGTGTVGGIVTLTADATIGGAGDLSLNGQVTGNAALTKVGAGTTTLAGNNNYNGQTNVNAGTLLVTNANALGTVANPTTITSGATLDVQADLVPEAIGVAGAGVGGFGAITTSTGSGSVAGAVTLLDDATIGGGVGAFGLAFNGSISGPNDLTLTNGNTALNGTVNVQSLTTGTSGTTNIGGNITTSGDQTYQNDATLTAALVTLSGGAFTFNENSNLDAAPGSSLQVTSTGPVTINGRFGAVQQLQNLTITVNETGAANNSIIIKSTATAKGEINVKGDVTLSAADDITIAGKIVTDGNKIDLKSTDTGNGSVITVTGTLEAKGAAKAITITGSPQDDTFNLDVSSTAGEARFSPAPKIVGNGGVNLRTTSLRLGGQANPSNKNQYFKPTFVNAAVGDRLFVRDLGPNSAYLLDPAKMAGASFDLLSYEKLGTINLKTGPGNNDVSVSLEKIGAAEVPSLVQVDTTVQNGGDNRFQVIGGVGADLISTGEFSDNTRFQLTGFSRLWLRGEGGPDTIDNIANVPALIEGGAGNDLLNSSSNVPTSKFTPNKKDFSKSTSKDVTLIVGGGNQDTMFVGSQAANEDRGTTFLLGDYEVNGNSLKFLNPESTGERYFSSSATSNRQALHGPVTGKNDQTFGSFAFPAGDSVKFSSTIGWLKGILILKGDAKKLAQSFQNQVRAYRDPVAPVPGLNSLNAAVPGVMLVSGEASPDLTQVIETPVVQPPAGLLPLLASYRTDVNRDGVVAPNDVLAIINDINARGSRKLPKIELPEGEDGVTSEDDLPLDTPVDPSLFFDVNDDGYVSALDSLLIINELNSTPRTSETTDEDSEAAPSESDDDSSTLAANPFLASSAAEGESDLLALLANDWENGQRK